MRVTAIQTSSIDDKAANLAAVRDLIATAVAADRPDLVLLPEVWAFWMALCHRSRSSLPICSERSVIACSAPAASAIMLGGATRLGL